MAILSVIKRLFFISLLTVCILGMLTAVSLALPQVYWNTVYRDVNTDMLIRDGIVLVPVRDLGVILGTPVSYNRKDLSYEFDFNGRHCIVEVNSAEYWIDENQFVFSEPTQTIDTSLYLPLQEFCNTIGIGYELKANRLNLTFKPEVRSNPVGGAVKNALIATTGDRYAKLSDSVLPRFDLARPPVLMVGPTTYPLKGKLRYNQDRMFVDMTDVLIGEGYKVSASKDAMSFARNGITVTFSLKTNTVTIRSLQGVFTKTNQNPAIKVGLSCYIPLSDVVSVFDYALSYDASKHIIQLLPKIQSVSVNKQAGLYTLYIKSSTQLSRPPSITKTPGKIRIDLPFTYNAVQASQVAVSESILTRIKVETRKNATQVVLDMSRSCQIKQRMTPDGVYMTFFPFLTAIEETKIDNGAEILLAVNGDYTYQLSKDKQTQTLNLLLPNVGNGVASFNSVFLAASVINEVLPTPGVQLVLTVGKPFTYNFQKTKEGLKIRFALVSETAILTEVSSTPPPGGQKLVVIDAGHGGTDPGAIGVAGDFEKGYTLDISRRVAELLIKNSYTVVMSRSDDSYVGLQERVVLANMRKASLFVSIHINSFSSPDANGTETYYFKAEDLPVSQFLQTELVKVIGVRNNGVKKAGLYVLRNSKMPAALVEPLFITNPSENLLLRDPEFRQKVAEAVCRGISAYFESVVQK